jgi:hypothetical protein
MCNVTLWRVRAVLTPLQPDTIPAGESAFWRLSVTEINKIFYGLCVNFPIFLLDFNQIWIFSTYLISLQYQISRISVQWVRRCYMKRDGPKDGRKL